MMARNDLTMVPLDRDTLVQVVHDFRACRTTTQLDGAALTTDARMNIAMADAALTISETARFKEVSDLLQAAGWDFGALIKHPERFVYWSRISCVEDMNIVKAFDIRDGANEEKRWAA
jgi:hypothetical protein